MPGGWPVPKGGPGRQVGRSGAEVCWNPNLPARSPGPVSECRSVGVSAYRRSLPVLGTASPRRPARYWSPRAFRASVKPCIPAAVVWSIIASRAGPPIFARASRIIVAGSVAPAKPKPEASASPPSMRL